MGFINHGNWIPNWIKRPYRFFRNAAGMPGNWFCCTCQGVQWRSDWILRGWVYFRKSSGCKIQIGHRFIAVSASRYNAIGVFQPVILTVIGHNSVLEIGDDVGMSGCSITACERITIGNRVLIGSGVLIIDNDAHPVEAEARHRKEPPLCKPIQIDDDVFIGARAIILKGVHIHRGAVVGAGAVVTRDVPEYAIVAGNPAKVVGDSRQTKKSNNEQQPPQKP